MHLHHFKEFDLNSKACITWKKGVLLAYRTQGNYYMSLYRMDDFYVEIQYHTCHDGVASVQTFVCEDELEAYLDQVNINKLLE